MTSVHHAFVVQSEVVPQLVNDGLADLAFRLAPIARDAQNRTAKDHHLIGQRRMRAKDAEKLVVVILEHFQILVGRFGLDEDGDILQELRELRGQLAEGVLDELLEFAVSDYHPGMMLKPNVQP